MLHPSLTSNQNTNTLSFTQANILKYMVIDDHRKNRKPKTQKTSGKALTQLVDPLTFKGYKWVSRDKKAVFYRHVGVWQEFHSGVLYASFVSEVHVLILDTFSLSPPTQTESSFEVKPSALVLLFDPTRSMWVKLGPKQSYWQRGELETTPLRWTELGKGEFVHVK